MRTLLRLRAAFTLVELLAACVVLGVGVLGLASTSVAVARLTGDSARAGAAVERGQAHVEVLRSGQCAAASGTLNLGGIAEWWSAAPAPGGAMLEDSVRYTEGAHHTPRTEKLATGAWCP